jgi:transposase
MSKQPRVLREQRRIIGDLAVVNPDAAGIDAGSASHLVSVREDRSDAPVRTFGTFTEDLNDLARWLVSCGVKTVAIEATGVYWVPLYEILEAHGLHPRLVDSRSIGRKTKKTDVLDCQWIRQLHMYGLLDGAFRPSADLLPLRALSRQRDMLIRYAADHIRHMQKALDLMNVKLHLIVSDVVGVTGLRIIRAILGGMRKAEDLAALRERSCRASEEEFVKALTGNFVEEHLFALRQALDLFEFYEKKIMECDVKCEEALQAFAKVAARENLPHKTRKRRRKNQRHFDARALLYEITGIDLTAVAGLEASSLLTITSEVGFDMTQWSSAKAFAAWLALCPNNRITGGKPIRKRNQVLHPNRAALAFRLAAQTLERSQTALGAFFRRVQSRLGRQGAIKATAHKLAIIFYSMLKYKTAYRDPGINYYEERYRQRLLKSLKKKAATLGFTLTAVQEVH